MTTKTKPITKAQIRRNLEWVKRRILAEPKRYDQGSYLANKSCGSVGCIAGWLDAKKNGFKVHSSRVKLLKVSTEAQSMLGISEGPWLFVKDFADCRAPRELHATILDRNIWTGTTAYARIACKAIDLYLKEIGA